MAIAVGLSNRIDGPPYPRDGLVAMMLGIKLGLHDHSTNWSTVDSTSLKKQAVAREQGIMDVAERLQPAGRSALALAQLLGTVVFPG